MPLVCMWSTDYQEMWLKLSASPFDCIAAAGVLRAQSVDDGHHECPGRAAPGTGAEAEPEVWDRGSVQDPGTRRQRPQAIQLPKGPQPHGSHRSAGWFVHMPTNMTLPYLFQKITKINRALWRYGWPLKSSWIFFFFFQPVSKWDLSNFTSWWWPPLSFCLCWPESVHTGFTSIGCL